MTFWFTQRDKHSEGGGRLWSCSAAKQDLNIHRLDLKNIYVCVVVRVNLAVLPTGEMIYHVAAVIVLHNIQEQSQRHYLGRYPGTEPMPLPW